MKSDVTGQTVLPKGTVVKVRGVPFRLSKDVPAKGANRPLSLADSGEAKRKPRRRVSETLPRAF